MSGILKRPASGVMIAAALLASGPVAVASEPREVLPAGTLEELQAYVQVRMEAEHVPGLAYVVVQGDQVVDARAFGVKKLGGGEVVNTQTVFEIGSASKAFTAAMLAMLVEEGKVSWDDRVVDHLPSFRMQDRWVTTEMRVADLVCQRSGMPGYSLDNMAFLGFGREEIIRALRFVEPVTSFRSAFAYQNNLWLVASALIEQKSGFTWEDNLDRRILGPLDMASSTTNPEVVATLPDVATGHFWRDDGTLVPMPPDWPYHGWMETLGPAGSIHSTVLDLAQWVRVQINLGQVDDVRVLQPTSVAYLHAPKTLAVSASTPSSIGDVFSYASGWVLMTSRRHPVVWHNGGTVGMHSIVGYIPEAGAGLAMLTNEPKNMVPEEALSRLTELVLGLSAGVAPAPEALVDGVASPSVSHVAVVPMGPPLPLERYVGTYTNPAYGPFEVRTDKGHLEMTFGPKRFVGAMQPLSGNTFTMQWPGWPGFVSTVTFTVTTGRPAEKMTVSLFEDVRRGEFVRAAGGAGH